MQRPSNLPSADLGGAPHEESKSVETVDSKEPASNKTGQPLANSGRNESAGAGAGAGASSPKQAAEQKPGKGKKRKNKAKRGKAGKKIKPIRCLVPCGVDQDTYFRLTRDIAKYLKHHKPAVIHGTCGRLSMLEWDFRFLTLVPVVWRRQPPSFHRWTV